MGRTFNTLATALLVVCALIVTGLLVRKEFFLGAESISSRTIPEWKEVVEGGRWIGSKNARILVVEFFDYECPPCSNTQKTLAALKKKYKDDIAFILYNLPSSEIHPNAYQAALAAECAGLQDKYESYHSLLLKNQDLLGEGQWVKFARFADIPDLEGFQRCVQTKATSWVIERDIKQAKRFGIEATPTLIINGRVINGDPGISNLERIIEQALEKSNS